MNNKLALLCGTLLLTGLAHGQIVHYDYNTTIVDGDAAGTAFAANVSISATAITSLKVSLWFDSPNALDRMYNGDMYVVLTHEDNTGAYAESYLLTRPGRDATHPTGYSDSGLGSGGALKLTFDDQALHDVHTYRDQTGALAGPLTGSWQPSARSTATPGQELSTTYRDPNLKLSAFNGMNPNGTWWLFVSDMATGGTARLRSVDLNFNSVPEPALYAVVGGACLLGFACWNRVQKRQRTAGR